MTLRLHGLGSAAIGWYVGSVTASMPLPREPEEEDAIATRDERVASGPRPVKTLPSSRPENAGSSGAEEPAPRKTSPRTTKPRAKPATTRGSSAGAAKGSAASGKAAAGAEAASAAKAKPAAAAKAKTAASKGASSGASRPAASGKPAPRKPAQRKPAPRKQPTPRTPSARPSTPGTPLEKPVSPPEAPVPGPPPIPAALVEADGETILVPPKPPPPAALQDGEQEPPAALEVVAVEGAVVEETPAPVEVPVPPEQPPATEHAETDDDLARTEPEASVPALELRGVTKTFGDTRAVDGMDLTVPRGTFYAIVGPNGAGKTTTLSMIAGLLRPTRGSISVGGVDAAADPRAAKRAMGVLPDRLRTFDRLAGRQLLYYYGVLRGLPAAVVEARTADLARAFDLTDALGRVVSDYSAGMTKKIMLAGAMIHSPRLLVLDEPFEAVDPVSSAIILDILSAYVAGGGTVVLSSHGMELVERVCTRVAVIVAGQVLAEGTIDEVRGELTLEERFIELSGGLGDMEGLEWLHTSSD